MPERLTPGVYVDEVSSGIRPIQGVGTSMAAFIGEAARGVPDQPTFLTGFGDFERRFGPIRRGAKGHLATAVQAFFDAGGRRCYVVRVLPSDAVKGQSVDVDARGPDALGITRKALRFSARGTGKWSKAIRIHIENATSFQEDAFRVRVEWTENGTSQTVETFDNVRMDSSHEDYVVEVINDQSKYIEAIDLFDAFVDDDDPDEVSLPEALPALSTDTELLESGKYIAREGAELTFSWTDGSTGASEVETVEVDQDFIDASTKTNPEFENGSCELTPKQLRNALTDALSATFRVEEDSDVVTVEPAVATQGYLLLEPDGASGFTFTAGAQTHTLVDDATTLLTFDTSSSATLTAEEVADLIEAELSGDEGIEVEHGEAGVLIKVAAATAGRQLALSSSGSYTWTTTAVGGAEGTVVDSMNGITISVAETLGSGVRQLAKWGFVSRVTGVSENASSYGFLRPDLTEDDPIKLSGGTDGKKAVDAARFAGSESERTGLHAFDTVTINMLCLPGKTEPSFLGAGMSYADRHNAFFIADGPGTTDKNAEIVPSDAQAFVEGLPQRSKNAAMFYPWIRISDPTGVGRNPTRFVPPSGHMAGVFARTDLARGVWKAPAGIEAVVNGALETQYRVLDGDQDLLNPIGLNCIRRFPGTGIVVWGSRTLSSDPEWRYVSVRRTALFLKESLRRGMQWAVFEPNDQELWDRIRINITSFMLGLFRQGAFQGASPEEAFLVKCDRETNPQELVDQGIVTAQVAFAPLKPAEFVVIQISQKALVS